MLCSLEKIWKYFNGEPLLRDINFTINEGERIGLVGRNGCGKTTLLSIITGNLGYDPSPENDGRMSFSGNCRIGYLEQGVGLSAECSVSEEMRKPFAELDREHERMAELENALSGSLSDSEREKAEAEYSSISTHFENNEGYLIDVKIKTVLNGMGFSGLDLSRSVNFLSGGERTRLSLAKLLLESPSLLILDEPTNHLDLDTMTWLEDYLLDYKGAIFVVSHNRYFLDKVCTKICEIEDGRLKSYSGNYSFYVKQKREDNLRQEKLYEAEQEKIKELQFFIDKNRVSATSAKAAKSKQHMLDRIADRIVEIRDGKAYEYKGNYDDYLKARELEKAEEEKAAVPSPAPAEKKQYRTKSQRAEDVRKKQELADLEKSIANLEKEIADTEELICTPEIAADYQKMTELCQSLDDRKNELSELMDRWVEIQE